MTPEEFKAKADAAYQAAIKNMRVFQSPPSGLKYLLRDVALYGREAGKDFIATHIEAIRTEIIDTAEARQHQIEI